MADYPVKGAVVKCNKSALTSTFEPIKATGSIIGKKLVILKTDTSSNNIVGSFGQCTGNGNQLCIKSFEGVWQNSSSVTYDIHHSLKSQYKSLFLEIQRWYPDKKFAFTFVGFDSKRYSATLTPANISNFTQFPPHIITGDNAFQLGLAKMKSIVNTKGTLPLGFAGDATGMFPTKEEKERWLAKIDELYEQSKSLPPLLISANINVVTTSSYLKCKYGIVSFVVGEEGQEQEEPPEDLDNLKDLRERVREVIRKHYDVGSPSEAERTAYAEQKANEVERAEGMTDEQHYAAKEAARKNALDNFKTADDKLKNEMLTTYNVSGTTDDSGKEIASAEDNANSLINWAKMEALNKRKAEITTQLAVAKAEGNTVEESRISTQLTYINKHLTDIGTVAEQTEILSAKSNYLNGLAQTETNVRLRRIVETKALAEFAIIEFGVNEAGVLELMAWLILLNENEIGNVLSLDDNGESILDENDDPIITFVIDTAIEIMSEHVGNGDYEDFGIDVDQSEIIVNRGDFAGSIESNKQKAYTLPVQNPLYSGKLTVNFYLYRASYTGHMGIDMGDPGLAFDICASYSGIVKDKTTGLGNLLGSNSYGNKVIIQGENRDFMFCHMESVSINLSEFVLAGKYLGRKGNSGNSDGAHLHYEVRLIDGGSGSNMHIQNGADYDIDPNDYLPEGVKHIFISNNNYQYVLDKSELRDTYKNMELNFI